MIKFFHRHWRRRWERFYHKNRWHLILDLGLFVIIIMLGASVVALHFYRPNLPQQLWNLMGTSTTIDINNPPLEIAINSFQPSFSDREGVAVGISLHNKGKATISNIILQPLVVDQADQIDRLEKEAAETFFSINNQQIIINSLKPQEKKDLTLRLYFNLLSDSRTIPLKVNAEYSVGRQIVKETSSKLLLQRAAELTARAVAYYNSPQGDQLGIGPIPPIVGIPTKYWIFWEISSQGDFKNLVMSAKLPLGVDLNTNRSLLAGELNYNPGSRQLIWTIPEIVSQGDNYRVGFEVQLVPTMEQLGQVVPLATAIQYYAQDALSGAEVSGSLDNIDTNLPEDRINRGQGKVIE